MNSKKFWESQHHKYAERDWINRPTIFSEIAIKYFPSAGKILELGCGQGQDARFFADRNYNVLATDFSNTGLNYAKTKTDNQLIKFQVLDMSKGALPFEDSEFDVVYSHLALHYFPDDITKKLFSEIKRVLKPNGIFAALFNTVEDPEIPELKEIDKNYYLETKTGIKKRYFDLEYLKKLTRDKFKTIIVDDKGETYKDEIKTLIRFIGKK